MELHKKNFLLNEECKQLFKSFGKHPKVLREIFYSIGKCFKLVSKVFKLFGESSKLVWDSFKLDRALLNYMETLLNWAWKGVY